MSENYQICTSCVMDTSDPEIVFDKEGVCSHCKFFKNEIKPIWPKGEEANNKLNQILDRIRTEGKGKKYDCILGVSGGVDSSYLAHLTSKVWGIRALAVHVNAGWNSEIAESNIEKIIKKCDLDLYTYVVDWEEIRDLQLSYLKSGIANQDVPQDHVFFAVLYRKAIKENIKFVLTGFNYTTESILPSAWGYDAGDAHQIKAIHSLFGSLKLKSYKTFPFFMRYIYIPYIARLKIIHPLNYIEYDKNKVKDFLISDLGWKDYGLKHGESYFTRIFQNYWLPTRFGYDKRRAHLSSMIVSGYLTRNESLEELEKPLYEKNQLELDIDYLCNKLSISRLEFKRFLEAPLKSYLDYPSDHMKARLLTKLLNDSPVGFIWKKIKRTLRSS